MNVQVAATAPAVLTAITLLFTGPGTVPVERRAVQPSEGIVFTGTVTDASKSPLAGVMIRIAPWNAGTLTNAQGRYVVSVSAAKRGDNATISVQNIGYNEKSQQVRITADSMRVDFQLDAQPLALQEVVVTGEGVRGGRADGKVMAAAPEIRLRRSVGFTYAGVSNQGAGRGGQGQSWRRGDPRDFNTESYAAIEENPFLAATANSLSTFSIDVDRASYANVRRFINEGRLPPKDAVRIEELVNYFTYNDPVPRGSAPFTVRTELNRAPWRPAHKLLRIALKARDIDIEKQPANNLVFLIDVSGSMTPENKLPLLKQSFALLVNELRPIDRVALVVYAGNAGLVLESTPGDRKEVILRALERLEAGGSTAGGAGLRLAYDVAKRSHIEGGNNRVILATDGDFNVGESSDAAMMRLVEERREQGTFLTVLGFGVGNLKDSKMETLADKGNGNYAYIDDIAEARKTLVHELGGTLITVAKDVKLQVEFNPHRVRAYRLIGYENRLLAAEDFKDDKKDAGELGAGHTVTALYEIVPVGVKTDVQIRTPDSLRYQTPAFNNATAGGSELAFVKLRYKAPDGKTSTELSQPVTDQNTRATTDFTFAAAVASFGMVLRDSPHKGNATLQSVVTLAKDGVGEDRGGYRAGFVAMVESAARIGKPLADREQR
jgi:Ca-activated chloride channel family protein